MTITRRDIIVRISKNTEISQSATKEIIEEFLKAIYEALRNNDRVELRGFGVFKTRMRDRKYARNLQENKPLLLEKRRVVYFKPSCLMKRDIK